MAFGLAVYASQDGLPRHHARLASGRWSGATGRAFHPQGSNERFQSCFLTSLSPFPSLAWRNRCDPSELRHVAKESRSHVAPHHRAKSGHVWQLVQTRRNWPRSAGLLMGGAGLSHRRSIFRTLNKRWGNACLRQRRVRRHCILWTQILCPKHQEVFAFLHRPGL